MRPLRSVFQQRFCFGDFFGDGLLQSLFCLKTQQQSSVDEERRRPFCSECQGDLPFRRDGIHNAGVLSVTLPGSEVQFDLFGVRFQIRLLASLGVGEQLIVHLPESTLLMGRRRRRGHGVGMTVAGQRMIAPLVRQRAVGFSMGLNQMPNDGGGPTTEGTFKITELRDDNQGLIGTQSRRCSRRGGRDGWTVCLGGLLRCRLCDGRGCGWRFRLGFYRFGFRCRGRTGIHALAGGADAVAFAIVVAATPAFLRCTRGRGERKGEEQQGQCRNVC